jgi:iron complex outermembrane receptor protein
LIDHETYGVTTEVRTVVADTSIKFGYAWTSTEPPVPPTARKQYSVSGAGATFTNWSLLAKTVDRHEFESVYLTGLRHFDALTAQGGIRYAKETLPSIDAYTAGTGASWDVSVDDALARATLNPARSVRGRSFAYWLPQAGLGYDITPAAEVHASLGRNIGAPSFDAFNQAPTGGITTSQGYWDQIRPELSTNLYVGSRLRYGGVTLDPTLYWSRSHNKAVSVYSAASKSVWSQNVGQTEAKGMLLAAVWAYDDSLRVFGAYSYSRSYFIEDVVTAGGVPLSVNGKQLPDVPTQMANVGVAWPSQGVTVAPVVQYIGSRWATTTYTERIPGYYTADLTLSYGRKSTWGNWEGSLAVLNLFDRRYIGQISTSEVNTAANGAIYYPGAPRTVVAKLSLNF